MKKIYQEVIQDSNIGYAYHKILCDSNDVPYDYKCIEVNKAFEECIGLKAEDLVGKKIRDLLPNLAEDGVNTLEYYGEIALNGNKDEYERYSEDTGKWYKVQVFSPKKYHFVINCTDITELKTLSNELKKSQKNLLQLMDAIPSIIFWKDLNFKFLGGNSQFAEYAGLPIDEIIGKDDYEMEWKEFAETYRKDDEYIIETGESKLNFEEKIIASKGDVRWIRTNKIPLYDNDNNIYGILGNFEDITKQKEIETALRNSESRYKELTEKSRSVVWEVDKDGRYTYISPVAEEVYGYKPEEMVGKLYVYDFPENNKEDDYKDFMLAIIKNKQSVTNFETRFKTKGNENVWVSINGFPVLDDKGELILYKGIDIDITYLKEIEEKITFLSFRDGLTGLYNRRFFEEELLRLDTERNLPLSLITIDVDGLKLVNDAFGHRAGDLLLKKIAEIIKSGCRADDIASRVGGDEFLILLPKTSLEEAKSLISRINMSIKEEKVEAVNLSISYGCATKKNIYENIETILKKSDIEMYNYKIRRRPGLRSEIIETILERLFEENPNERDHAKSVGELSAAIGRALKFSGARIEKLRTLGEIHDIGKIVIKKDILSKGGKLTEDEWEEIKRHPEAGYIILSSSSKHIPFADDVLYHHERYDGKGYPKGLKGDKIPLNSRILALATAYDIMIWDRHNRRQMSRDEVMKEILKESGKQFDPKLVKAFVKANLAEEYKKR